MEDIEKLKEYIKNKLEEANEQQLRLILPVVREVVK